MLKRVWVLHHYADPPDGHWTGTYDLYKLLVRKGHDVTIVSSSFSHYSRRETRLRGDEKYQEQNVNGVRFVFVRTTPYAKNNWRRLLNMLTYSARAYGWGARQQQRPDVIVTATPHAFCAFTGYLLARKFGVHFLLELHDLWLEYVIDTGMFSTRNPLYMGLRWIETRCYKHAKAVVTLWPGMDRYLKKFGVPGERIVWLPLGIDFMTWRTPEPKRADKDGTFVAMCTARFGPASNVGEILQAAKILRDGRHEGFRFVVIGDGPEKDRLVGYAMANDLTNVEFRGLVPKEEIPSHLAEADVCIAGLPDVPNYKKYGTIPTKLLDYMGSNRPTIFITSIEGSLVESARAGLVVPPNAPTALAKALLDLRAMSSQERAAMGDNGLRYLRANHDLKKLADRLETLL